MNNPRTDCKTYWSLKTIDYRRKPLIPPNQTGDKFINYFTEKAKAFKNYFAKQCRVIDNNSQLPDHANFCTNVRLNNIKFANADILNILKNFNTNKTHGHNNLSIRIIKSCSESVCKTLELYF